MDKKLLLISRGSTFMVDAISLLLILFLLYFECLL